VDSTATEAKEKELIDWKNLNHIKKRENDKDRRLNNEKKKEQKKMFIHSSWELKAHGSIRVVCTSVCLCIHESHKYQYHPPFKINFIHKNIFFCTYKLLNEMS